MPSPQQALRSSSRPPQALADQAGVCRVSPVPTDMSLGSRTDRASAEERVENEATKLVKAGWPVVPSIGADITRSTQPVAAVHRLSHTPAAFDNLLRRDVEAEPAALPDAMARRRGSWRPWSAGASCVEPRGGRRAPRR